jgi:hypothetical protein
MVKKGDKAIADLKKSQAGHPRCGLANEASFTRGTLGTVVNARWNRYGRLAVRALIDGRVCTLHPPDWVFTSIRVGELRRWCDDREEPFLVLELDATGCICLSQGKRWGATIRYIESESEVISD